MCRFESESEEAISEAKDQQFARPFRSASFEGAARLFEFVVVDLAAKDARKGLGSC